MINIFYLVVFLCSIVLCMSILLTLSGRHPHYPYFIHHFKRKTWVDGPCSGVCKPKGEQRNFHNEEHYFVLLRRKPKNRRREKPWNALLHPHPVSFSLQFFLLFFSRCLSLRDWGFPVTWALGSPLPILSLVLNDISFYLFHFPFHSVSVYMISLSLSLSLLSVLGFLRILSVCLRVRVCDRAAWQEGRQADGHWDLEWLRSGASGAHGEHVFPTSEECQRTPIHCPNPQHSFL